MQNTSTHEHRPRAKYGERKGWWDWGGRGGRVVIWWTPDTLYHSVHLVCYDCYQVNRGESLTTKLKKISTQFNPETLIDLLVSELICSLFYFSWRKWLSTIMEQNSASKSQDHPKCVITLWSTRNTRVLTAALTGRAWAAAALPWRASASLSWLALEAESDTSLLELWDRGSWLSDLRFNRTKYQQIVRLQLD